MVLICLLGKFSEKLSEQGGVVVLICLLGTFSGKWVIEAIEFNFEAVSNLQGNLEAQIGHKLNRMIQIEGPDSSRLRGIGVNPRFR